MKNVKYKKVELIFVSFVSVLIKIYLIILNISKIREINLYNFFCSNKIINIDLKIKCYTN